MKFGALLDRRLHRTQDSSCAHVIPDLRNNCRKCGYLFCTSPSVLMLQTAAAVGWPSVYCGAAAVKLCVVAAPNQTTENKDETST